MGQTVGKLEFYAGPKAVGAPDNLEQVVVDFIDGAGKRLEIAVQELESVSIAQAIIRARQRKVMVKIVFEQLYLESNLRRQQPWEKGGEHEPNRQIHNAFLRARIDVKVDYYSSIFHQKFIVRDRTSLLTASTNFTSTGTHKDLNHIIVIHDETVAKIYAREFMEIQQGHFGKLNEGHDPWPSDVLVSNVPVRLVFAPDHNPEMEIIKQMQTARERIDFAVFTFSRSSGIDDTMLRLLDLGIPIRGAFNSHTAAPQWAASQPLRQKGAQFFLVPPGNGVGKLHHKLMVLDGEVVIGGTFNYTGPANNLNDENIIILGDLDTPSAAARKAQKKIGQFALNEIDRIINAHGVAT